MTAPGPSDMEAAKLLYIKLKMSWKGEIKSLEDLKIKLGDGGEADQWSKIPGLRHTLFLFNEENNTYACVCLFFNQESLDMFLDSDLFKQLSDFPHIDTVDYEIHGICSGSECSVEKTPWAHIPPTREDVVKAYALIVHLTINYDAPGSRCPDEKLFRDFLKASGPVMGIPGFICDAVTLIAGPGKLGRLTKKFSKTPGLRSKYFVYRNVEGGLPVAGGFYIWTNKSDLEKYLASDDFNSNPHPHIESIKYTVYEILPGTEKTMDLGDWTGK